MLVPDIIVNNAGLFEPGSVHNEPEGLLENQLAINLYSAYHLTRTLLPKMMERRSGHIFNMCSIASVAVQGQTPFAARDAGQQFLPFGPFGGGIESCRGG